METSSLIYFQEACTNGETWISAVVYQKGDGSLAGVGRVLASFLKKVRTESAPNYDEGDIICSGFGDLVANFIQMHKEVKPVPFQSPPAPFLIYPAINGQKEEFTYYVTFKETSSLIGFSTQGSTITVENNEQKSGEMTIEEFHQQCEQYNA